MTEAFQLGVRVTHHEDLTALDQKADPRISLVCVFPQTIKKEKK